MVIVLKIKIVSSVCIIINFFFIMVIDDEASNIFFRFLSYSRMWLQKKLSFNAISKFCRPISKRLDVYCKRLLVTIYRTYSKWMELPFGKLSYLVDRPPRDQLVLWRGLFRKWRSKIKIDRTNVLRVTDDFNWWQIKTFVGEPFIAHDKRLTRLLKRNQK